MRASPSFLAAVLLALLAVVAASACGGEPAAVAAPDPLLHREAGYVGSAACRECHQDQHASWAATHHSTMTQRPSAATVLGRFDGMAITQGQDRARPFRDGERFLMELQVGGVARTAEVELLVGSRRYQQYFERRTLRDGASFFRLPILWHVELQRWLPVDSVFLGPDADGLGGHAAEWNTNCILCHNTGPRPGLLGADDPARLQEGNRFDSHVAELGIACEACHGPGERHVATARSVGVGGAHAIVHPDELDKERAVAVCGQCHGARLPEPPRRAREWFTTGPTFRPGEKLVDHVKPIERGTPVRGGGDPEAFALRFWGDGTPRLTAYEYQGVVASKCFTKGQLTCTSCHAMHDGDPKGQLRPDVVGNALCTQCHEDIGRDVAAHSKHPADGPGSSCLACHMPKVVFGVADIHRSHRIDNPDPARDGEAGRPHACTLCHVDRSLPWAADAMRRWWGDAYRAPTKRFAGAPLALADAAANLFAGDAAARAVAAKALGEPTATFAPDHAVAVRAWLAITMGDGWPSVRLLARRSLSALEARRGGLGVGARAQAVDHLAGVDQRRKDVFALLDAVAAAARTAGAAPPPSAALLGRDFRVDLARVVELTDLQGRNLIAIGE
ncbi:MAG: cytochrome c3 family protein [Planctomycetota bacterium]